VKLILSLTIYNVSDYGTFLTGSASHVEHSLSSHQLKQ